MLKPITHSFDQGDGRIITIETGKLARQADGAVTVRMGDCILLCTIVSAQKIKPGQDFFPLSVDYQEKFASSGRIPGGFFKRESKLSDYEVLICRLVDRALRPMFPDGYLYETQVLIYQISGDNEVLPDSLAGLAASAALAVSDIPFNGPISEVRVARIDGKFVINPTRSQLPKADLELIVAASEKDVVMVEGEAKECSEEDLVEAIKLAHEAIKLQCKAQLELAKLVEKAATKRELVPIDEDAELQKAVADFATEKLRAVVKSGFGKSERKKAFEAIYEELLTSLGEIEEEKLEKLPDYYHDLEKFIMRDVVLGENIRLDGRKLDEVRPIYIEVDNLPSPHGSALFTRGETQSLTTVTLGTKDDEQMLDKAYGLEYVDFILHYNFPPFSTGEIKPMRGPGRREVGHGNLAMRSLRQMMPTGEDNPYTIRIVSDILESNGSSSMATVCAGSLALMDAGVKVKAPVAGIAMGLIADNQGRYAILSDILGDEDHLGDMDFKVTGTEKGICGCQMDIKVDGLSYEVLIKALNQAKQGRLHILGKMNAVLDKPRTDYKPHAPRIIKLYVDREFIGPIIGPGGKHIQELQRETGTTISIEEIGDQGEVVIFGKELAGVEQATARVRGIASKPEVGTVYEGKVKGIQSFGAFVEFLPAKEGLLHISEISWKRLETMDGVLNQGDMIKVKLIGVDPKTGKFKLSHKELIPRPENPNHKHNS